MLQAIVFQLLAVFTEREAAIMSSINFTAPKSDRTSVSGWKLYMTAIAIWLPSFL